MDNLKYEVTPLMTDSFGKNIYAYVTIMTKYEDLACAIVLAQSLRELGSQADFIVMVTKDISDEDKNILKMFYHIIKEINYIEIDSWRVKENPKLSFLNFVFTKFYLFNLSQYKKILFVSPFTIFLGRPDHFFSLQTPSSHFVQKELQFENGVNIPKEITSQVKENFLNDNFLLVEPKVGEFDNIIESISGGDTKYLIEKKFMYPSNQYITLRYSGKWKNISKEFMSQTVIQYQKSFIYNLTSDSLFYSIYEKLLKSHYLIRKCKTLRSINKSVRLLKETNHSKLSVQPADHNIIEIIKREYEIKKVHSSLLKYYYTQRDTTFLPTKILRMFDVEEYDYLKPIIKLNEYYNYNCYYDKVIKKVDPLPIGKSPLNNFDIVEVQDMDLIMLEYAKCREKLFILTLWPIAEKGMTSFLSYLKDKGNIYYVKTIQLSKLSIKNLMFWMYNEFSFKSRLEFIKKKLEYSEVNELNNLVTFIFFDNIHNLKLGGQASQQKKIFRDELLKILNLQNKNIRGNDVLHVNDFFSQTIEYSQMILNQNSLNLLSEQNLDNYTSTTFSKTNLCLQTYRKWIYDNLTLAEMDRLINMGSIVLFAYGIRKSNDIDAVFVNSFASPSSEEEKNLEDLFYTHFVDKNNKFNFADIGKEKSKHWRESWTKKNTALLSHFDAETMTVLATDPSLHLYHNGIKIYTFQFEIMRKLIRNEVNDIADFLMLTIINENLVGKYMYFDSEYNLIFNEKYHGAIPVKKFTFTKENLKYIMGQVQKNYLKSEYKLIKSIGQLNDKIEGVETSLEYVKIHQI